MVGFNVEVEGVKLDLDSLKNGLIWGLVLLDFIDLFTKLVAKCKGSPATRSSSSSSFSSGLPSPTSVNHSE